MATQTFYVQTKHVCQVTLVNTSTKSWTFLPKVYLNNLVAAQWNAKAIAAGAQAIFKYDIIFGTYLTGDADYNQLVNIADSSVIANMILDLTPPNAAADANQDGLINSGDRTQLDLFIMNPALITTKTPTYLSAGPPVGVGSYTVKVVATETSTLQDFILTATDLVNVIAGAGVSVVITWP